MRYKRLAIIVGVVLAAALVVWAIRPHFAGIAVEVAVAEQAPLFAPLSTDGVVEAIEVRLAPEAGGTLTELFVDEGDAVSVGEILAHVTDRKAAARVAEARGAFDAAVAQVKVASADVDLQRGQSAAQIDASTATVGMEHAQLDKARRGPRQQEIAQAEATVRAAQAEIGAAEAGVEAARIALAETQESSAARIRMAEGELAAAEAQLDKAHAGARPQEIGQARAAQDAAAAQSHNLKLQYDRAKRLHTQGAMSKSDLDNAEAAMLAAKAQERAAAQALDLLLAGVREEDIATAQARVKSAGSRVEQAKAGQRLVEVQRKELEAAKARLEYSKAVLAESRQYAEMLREGTREEDLRTQEQRLAMAQAQQRAALASRSTVTAAVQRLEAAIAEQKRAAAGLDTARSHLSDTIVTSPIDGVVVKKLTEAGEIVGPQVPILVLVNNTDVWVIADVDDEDISRVRVGQATQVLCEAYPDRTFEGEVVRIGEAAMPKGLGRVKAKIVRVKIQVADAAPLLKPGMAVDIEGDAELKASTLLVAADAVIEEATEQYVYVVRDGRAHKTVVETGFSNYTQTEITSGLSEGDGVVVSGKDELHDGVRVSVKQAPQSPNTQLEATR